MPSPVGEVGALQAFAAADVDDVRIGRRDRDGADRAGRLARRRSASTCGRRRSSSRRRRSRRRCRTRWAATECRRPPSCGRRGRARCCASAARRRAPGRRVPPAGRAGSRWRGPRRWRAPARRRPVSDASPSKCGSTSVCQPRGKRKSARLWGSTGQGYGCDSIVAHEANSRRGRCGDRHRGRGSGCRSGRERRRCVAGRHARGARVPEHRSDDSHGPNPGRRDRSEEPERLVRGVSVRRRVEDRRIAASRSSRSSTQRHRIVHAVLRRHRSEGLERHLARQRRKREPAQCALRRRRLQVDRRGQDVVKNVGLETSEHIGKIVIDPRNSNVVWVAAQGPLFSEGGERGLYKTTDGGTDVDRVAARSTRTPASPTSCSIRRIRT